MWSDARNGNSDIYGFDLVTKSEFPICTAPETQIEPAIDGNIVVWTDGRGGIRGAILVSDPPTLYSLTMQVSPGGPDTIFPAIGEHEYEQGTVVPLSATDFLECPDVYEFDHWEGNVDNVSSSNTTILMNDNQTVTAVFVPTRQCGDECHFYPVGDFDQNCYVNWADFSIFASHWLEGGCTDPDWCGRTDLNQAGEVTWGDFGIFSEHWLECTAPECD